MLSVDLPLCSKETVAKFNVNLFCLHELLLQIKQEAET